MPTVELNATPIVYAEVGPSDGTPVLLSHSLFFDHTMFDELAAILAERGYRVVSYDQRGQGGNPAATRDEVSMDALTDDAASLIGALGLGRVHVAGNSLGGFVALRLAARHPDLVISAAAIGSSAEEEHSLAAFAPLVDHLTDHGAADIVGSLMHIMFGDTSLASPTAATKKWEAFMADLGPSIGPCAWQVIHRDSIVAELAGCAVPVLAIAGAEDHAYPPPTSSDNIAAATGGRAVTVEAAGHSVSLEQPTIVADHLLTHFAAAERGSPWAGRPGR